jgi:hypothetical protein
MRSQQGGISDSVEGLLCSFEKDEDSMFFGTVILGLLKFLAQCKSVLDGAESNGREDFDGNGNSFARHFETVCERL